MQVLRTSRRDKGDGFPGAGSCDVGGEEDGADIVSVKISDCIHVGIPETVRIVKQVA